jgi:transposase-like protein
MENLRSAAATRGFLVDLARQLESYVRELENELEARPSSPTPHGSLALQCGIESYRAHARWARRAKQRFKSNKQEQGVG